MLMLGAHEGAYANAALFVALARKLIDKEVISKEDMSGIVDEAGVLLSQGMPFRCVRRFNFFLGSGRTLGSKMRQRPRKAIDRRPPFMTEATSSEPGHSPWLYETREVPLPDIAVLTRLRPLEPALVDTLAVSMKVAGLTHAIMLRPAPAGYYLVVGWHRLEAARKLGWQNIRAVIFWNLTSDQAALLETHAHAGRAGKTNHRAGGNHLGPEELEGRRP
jgi:hypothetical protein